MSVRSVLNNFNNVFLVWGVGCINYSQSNFKKSVVLYGLRCILICAGSHHFFVANDMIIEFDQEMSEPTSIIYITCFELYYIGNIICRFWRIYFYNHLSMVLTKLEAIHEKLIRLKVVGPMKLKMNCYFNIGIILYVIANFIVPLVWMTIQTKFDEKDLVISVIATICEFIAFNEYILLILYIKWMVYAINEQIPERKSCLSTYRDMYLEVIECLHQVNTSIYGLPAIAVFIARNVADIIGKLYGFILFPRDYIIDPYLVFSFINLSTKTFNILVLYMISDTTEKEINRISDVLNQRSVIGRNPRIKRQIKFFLLRRLHEHYHFELFGIFHINLRQLHSLSGKAIGYLINRMIDVLHQTFIKERNPRIKRQIKFFLLRRLHEHYHLKLFGIFHINLRQIHS